MASKSVAQPSAPVSSQARPSSRSEQSRPSSKSELARPNSTSPVIQKKNGDPRTKTGHAPNGTAITAKSKTMPRNSSEAAKKTVSPGTTRKYSSPSGMKPISKGSGLEMTGALTNDKSSVRISVADSSRQKSTRSPTGEEAKRKQKSVFEKQSSPLSQRRTVASTTTKASSSPEESKLKKSAHTSSSGTTRRTGGSSSRPARGSVTQTDVAVTKARSETRQKKSSPSLARKQVNPGKPPSGAASSTLKQSAGSGNSKAINGGKAGGVSKSSNSIADRATELTASGVDSEDKSDGSRNAGSRGGSPIEQKANGSSGSSEKKAATSTLKKSIANGGRVSPYKDRKSSVEKRSVSAGNSPGTERKPSTTIRRQSGGSAIPGVPKRSAALRRIGSSGSIPVNQKTTLLKKDGSVSPNTERENKTCNASLGTRRRVSVGVCSAGKKDSGENPVQTRKATDGRSPTGRRSVHSRSEVALHSSTPKKNETCSPGRKISAPVATSSARGSPSPNTLAGKVVTVDPSDLQIDDRLQSTLKLFGVKGGGAAGGAARTVSKGPVIKAMGVGGRASPSGRITPVKRVGSPHTTSTSTTASKVVRTGSGSTTKKANPKTNLSSKGRVHSSDDILKAGRHSPADTGKSTTTSPLSQSAKSNASKTQGNEMTLPVKKSEKEKIGNTPTGNANTGEKSKGPTKALNPAVTNVMKTALVSRPSCRNTEVRSRITNWTQKEEETQKLVSPCISPVPPSSTSPHTPLSHPSSSDKSSSPSSPHISPITSPNIPLNTSSHSSPQTSSHPSPSTTPTHTQPNTSPRASSFPPHSQPSPQASSHPSPSTTPTHTQSHTSPRASSFHPHSQPSPQASSHPSPSTTPTHTQSHTSPRASSFPPHSQPSPMSSPLRQRSSSPVVISSRGTPVKSRIAMWTEKEKEYREYQQSLSPQRSPRNSPHSSPKGSPKSSPSSSPRGLRRQSPIDKHRDKPVSPARSTSSSRAGSVASSKASSASPPRQIPSIKVEEREEKLYEDIVASPKKRVSNSAAGVGNEEEVYEDIVSSPKKSSVCDNEVYEDIEASSRALPLSQFPVSEPCISIEEAATASLIQENVYCTIPEVYLNFPKGNHLHEEDTGAPKLPPRPMKKEWNSPIHSVQEGDMHVYDIEDDATLHGDMKASGSDCSKPNPVYTVISILDSPPASGTKESGYKRLKPSYTEIPILDDPPASGVPASSEKLHKSDSNLTPKSKRRWLGSPLFGRRKGSAGDDKDLQLEGASSDRERDEKEEKKNSKGFIKRLGKIGSRSSKERKAIKRKLAISDGPEGYSSAGKTSYDSDSDGSSSQEDSQGGLTVPSAEDSRTKSSTEIGQADQLKVDVIPRSNSYSPAASPLTTRKELDPTSQRVVSSDCTENAQGADESSHVGKGGGTPSATHNQKAASPQRGTTQRGLSRDIRNIIDSMAEGSEFLEVYSKKLSSETSSVGSAPSGLRLPVPFELKQCSSQPNLIRVGFDVANTNGPETSPFLSNGEESGAGDLRGESDSSTGSEGEEQGSSGLEREGDREEEDKEAEEDILCPTESSLDQSRLSRHDIKRKLSERSDRSCLPSMKQRSAGSQNPENLVVTSLMYADAVWDRVGLENDELSFRVGDVIEILDMSDDTWWQGNVREKSGWFPSTFVRLRIAQDEEEDDIYALPPDAGRGSSTLPRVTTTSTGDTSYSTYGRTSNSKRRMTIRRKDSCPSMPQKLTPAEVRAKVVEEILNTERDYVKHLEDIIEGFLKKCRLNTKLFDREKIEVIFSNIEALYQFQVRFLSQLEARVHPARLEDSQIGEVFVGCREGFAVYSEYCNNHPHAVNEMSTLQKKEQYAFFFESCRLLRNLQNIPLEGFLLLPVQKICKYPLQLSELLKYTNEDHPDRGHVEAAVDAMRQVAMHINEGKRRLENIGRIGKWQETIEGWKGPDIVETCTEMIHSSELHKISKGHSQERHFFLFDNQLIYCKKDVMGGRLCYKGRLSMETCHVTDLPDGQETHNGAPVKNAWKMDNKAKGKDYVIFAKTVEAKTKWMEAFRQEKERVAEDKEAGFSVSLKMKRAAAALSSSTSRVSSAKRRRSFNKKQILKVQALSESVDSVVKLKVEGSPARERKGKFSIMRQIF